MFRDEANGVLDNGEIFTMPAVAVRRFAPGRPWVLISIASESEAETRPLARDPALVARLDLTFSDPQDAVGPILDFFAAHRDTRPLWTVHCLTGMSRSPAVAAVLSEIVTGSPEPFTTARAPDAKLLPLLRQEAIRRGLLQA